MDGDKPEAGLYRPRFHHGTEPCSLYSLADWDNGLAFKNINFSERGLPVVKIAEIKAGIGPDTKFTDGQYNERALIADGDLLFCWSGQPETSIGTFRWWQGPAWLNQHVFKVTPKADLSADYLRHLLRYLQPQFVQIASNKQTTGLGHVTKADLRDMMVEVPSPALQDRIADALNPIDDKIELNRRMAATLEELARALFKSWFVDFAPVRAKAEGRDPGLPAATAALFPDRFGEDGLPVGWSAGTLADVSFLNPESRGSVSEGEIVYVDLANTKWGVIEATQLFAPDDAPSRAQRILRSGDTIVGTVRPGNGSYALVASNNLIGSTGFAVLRPKTPSLCEFVYLAATSGENIEALAALADGGAYPAVRPDVVADTPCCLVPAKVLEAFHAVTVDLMDRVEAARSQSATLGAIRDTLLPKLISGELRIKDANGAVEAA